MNWDQLKPEEKRAKYSKYACHELNYFLLRKDPAFFESVVLPYMQNKKDKTFLDRWLVGEELQGYLDPWKYAQLNMVERILLAQRLAGEQPQTSRAIADLYDLLPPDVDRFNFLFNTAVQGSVLEVGESLGKAVAQGMVRSSPGGTLHDAAPAQPEPDGSCGGCGPLRYRGGHPLRSRYRSVTDFADAERRPRGMSQLAEAKHGGRAGPGPSASGQGDGYYAADRKRELAVRQLYRQLDKTQEWAENNYYQLPIAAQNGALVPVNAFWRDYAAQDPKLPFRSTHLAEASTNFTEMMFALSVLDLPFRSVEHEATFNGAQTDPAPPRAR